MADDFLGAGPGFDWADIIDAPRRGVQEGYKYVKGTTVDPLLTGLIKGTHLLQKAHGKPSSKEQIRNIAEERGLNPENINFNAKRNQGGAVTVHLNKQGREPSIYNEEIAHVEGSIKDNPLREAAGKAKREQGYLAQYLTTLAEESRAKGTSLWRTLKEDPIEGMLSIPSTLATETSYVIPASVTYNEKKKYGNINPNKAEMVARKRLKEVYQGKSDDKRLKYVKSLAESDNPLKNLKAYLLIKKGRIFDDKYNREIARFRPEE